MLGLSGPSLLRRFRADPLKLECQWWCLDSLRLITSLDPTHGFTHGRRFAGAGESKPLPEHKGRPSEDLINRSDGRQ